MVSTLPVRAANDHTSLRTIKTPGKALPVLRSACLQSSGTDAADFWESFIASSTRAHRKSPHTTLPHQQSSTPEQGQSRSADGVSCELNVRHTPLEGLQERADQRISHSRSNPPQHRPAPPACTGVQHRRRSCDEQNRTLFQQRLRKITNLRQLEQRVASGGRQRAGSFPGASGPTRLSKLMLMEGEGGRIPDDVFGGMFATGDEEEAVVGFVPVRVLWSTKYARPLV